MQWRTGTPRPGRRVGPARRGTGRGGLDGYPLTVAVQADLVARQGDRVRAAGLFREAAAAVGSTAERRALLDRADELAR
ncbi:hypothetical protein NKG94_48845 [Micromonospora sp. M12]